MLITIITVYYNREKKVIDSINSLLNQTYKDIEIIAVDDGSTDNTLSMLRSLKDERYKVITHKNMGFVKSIKKAVNLAKGELIAVHGSGDYSYPKRIEQQFEVFKKNKNIGVVGCYVENYNEISGELNLLKPYITNNTSLLKIIKKRNLFTHGEVMFRKSVYDQVGGYREFFKFAQDRDLWIRMSLICDFHIVPKVLYKRYMLPDGVSTNSEKMAMQKFFNEISRQNIDLTLNGEKDLIERHGMYAPFFRLNSKITSKELLRLSLNDFMSKDLEMAKKMIILSIQEQKNLNNLLFYILISISSSNKIYSFMFALLKSTRNLKRKLKKVN